MKITFIFLISIISLSSLFSQDKKKKFYNEDIQEITEKEFYNQNNNRVNLPLYFESDSIISGVLIKRENKGKLTSKKYAETLKNISPNKKLKNDFIIIIYYPGKDKCNGREIVSTWNIFDKDYEKKLKKNNSVDLFWIYKNDENLKFYHPDDVLWQKDKNEFIEKLFFELHYPCFSAVVIDKQGNYISYFGEFGKHNIWEIVKKLKKA